MRLTNARILDPALGRPLEISGNVKERGDGERIQFFMKTMKTLENQKNRAWTRMEEYLSHVSSLEARLAALVSDSERLDRALKRLSAVDASEASEAHSKTTSVRRGGPTCVLIVGMAGAGKTTVVKRLIAHGMENHRKLYVINLDPAASSVDYPTNIDIRDTVDYRKVMSEHRLGPNGAIMTSLNLFATKFDQVMEHVEQTAKEDDFVIVDTPGQIEAFTWSASGAIFTESFASSLPTVLIFVVDSARSSRPSTFMSNMLYACSILYKTKIPMVLAFNKADVRPCDDLIEWMRDFEAFQEAMDEDAEGESYSASLNRSMALVLDEFYSNLTAVGVSAATGEGFERLYDAVAQARDEYEREYRPELERRKREKLEMQQRLMEKEAKRLAADMDEDRRQLELLRKELRDE